VSEPSDAFRPLHLSGGRYEQASAGTVGFPLEAIAELARYERLLIKVARELWRKENPHRTRAPKGFDEQLRLRLTTVTEGCVTPVFLRGQGDADRLFDPDGWMHRAQSSIAEALSAIVGEQPLPSAFPTEARHTLVQFGSSLRPDELCRIVDPSGTDVAYTQAARHHLVGIVASSEVTMDGTLVGRIGELDANRRTFRFSDRSGRRVEGSFRQTGLIAELRQFTERDAVATFVRLTCRYSTDAEQRVEGIEDVEGVEPIVAVDDPLGSRLRHLLELYDGWLDGDGLAPALGAIEWVRDFAAELTSEQLEPLVVGPTLEGGVLVEQQVAGTRWSLEIDPDGEVHAVTVPPDGAPVIQEIKDGEDAVSSLRALTT
jgi:hypothetical protein